MNDHYNNNQRRSSCTTDGQPRQLIPRATASWPVVAEPPRGPALPAGQPAHQYCQPQQVMVLSREQEKRLLDAWTTKLARTKRKMARQIRAQLRSSSKTSTVIRHSDSSSSFSSATGSATIASLNDASCMEGDEEEALPNSASPLQIRNNGTLVFDKQDLYSFFTPDNKRLRMLLKKELKNSDVGSLGRIVLPKREAEDKLPSLSDKEGIQVTIKDIYSDKKWGLRYKYWTNNKSRMYVLENTGDFVKQNGLQMGDSITLYEDECKNLYVAMRKANKLRPATSSETPCNLPQHANRITAGQYGPTAGNHTSRDEEDMASLAFLIEQLDRKDRQEAVNHGFVTSGFSVDGCTDVCASAEYSCAPQSEEEAKCFAPDLSSHQTSRGNAMKAGDESFDDWFGELETLPEIDRYDYYGYATLFDPMVTENKS